MRIRFDKVNGLIKIYNGIRYLELSDSYNEVYYGINSRIYNAIYIILQVKSGITDNNHTSARIRIDSYNSLPVEKALTFPNVIILIKSVVNENKNNYYYSIFSENKFV